MLPVHTHRVISMVQYTAANTPRLTGGGDCKVTDLSDLSRCVLVCRPQVYTSDLRGAGTDANVFLILYGATGLDSGSLKLDTSKNNFERGQEDVFMVQVGGWRGRQGVCEGAGQGEGM